MKRAPDFARITATAKRNAAARATEVYGSPATFARQKSIETNLERLKSMMTPHQPAEWEIRKAEREELARLRARVAELEAELAEMIDCLTETERRKTKKVRGRPVTRKPLAKVQR